MVNTHPDALRNSCDFKFDQHPSQPQTIISSLSNGLLIECFDAVKMKRRK